MSRGIQFLFVVTPAILLLALVPNRVRFALERGFAFLDTPFRDLAAAANGYLRDAPRRIKWLLAAGGIKSEPFFNKIVGSLFIFSITVISIIADLDLIVLTLGALGIGGEKASRLVLKSINPADALGLAIIGGAAMLGVLFLEYWIPNFLPDSMAESKKLLKMAMIGSAVLLVGAFLAVGCLANVRASAMISQPTIEEGLDLSSEDSEAVPSASDSLPAGAYRYLFIFVSILTLINSIIGSCVISSVLAIAASAILGLLLLPVGAVMFTARLVDRLITLLFNIALAVYNLFEGLLRGASDYLGRILHVDDSLAAEENSSQTDEHSTAPKPRQSQTSDPEKAVNPAAQVEVQLEASRDEAAEAQMGTYQVDAVGFNPLK